MDHTVRTMVRSFDHDPDVMDLDRLDFMQKTLLDMESNKGKEILILSWSKFTVPEAPSDV